MMLLGFDVGCFRVPECIRLLITLMASLFFTQSHGQLKAAFSADVTEGCAPLIVRFKDASEGNPISYKWYLGNNITPHTDKDPSTTYINPGTYTIKLVVRNATNTADSVEQINYIRVYATPVVN